MRGYERAPSFPAIMAAIGAVAGGILLASNGKLTLALVVWGIGAAILADSYSGGGRLGNAMISGGLAAALFLVAASRIFGFDAMHPVEGLMGLIGQVLGSGGVAVVLEALIGLVVAVVCVMWMIGAFGRKGG